MNRSIFIGVLVILSVMLPLNAATPHAQSKLRFAYLSSVQEDVHVHYLSPDEQVSSIVVPSLVTTGKYIRRVISAPQGTSAMVVVGTIGTRLSELMILDFATGEVRAVSDLQGVFQSTGARDSREHEAHVWSDDGKQLAVWFVRNGTTPTIAIVDIKTISVGYIQSDAQLFQRLAWSHNSQWLAVTAGRCDSDPCTSRLQIVDVQANRVAQQFAAPNSTVGYAGDMLCDLVWSPDDRYVAMRTVCSDEAIYSKREVFLADVTTGALAQLTNYNQQYENRIIAPYYRTFWLGDELLIGVLIYGETVLRLETLKYSPATKSLTTIDDARLEQIVRNPIASTLFVQRLTRDASYADNPLKYSAEVRDDQNTRTVSRLANLSGHDFSWSPDGEYFASTIRCIGTCTTDIQQIIIATASGEIVKSVTLEYPENDPTRFYVPLGWISQ